MTFKLTNPPGDERAKELWLQHAAGFILFQDMRKYAIDRIPGNTDDQTKELILRGIDDALIWINDDYGRSCWKINE